MLCMSSPYHLLASVLIPSLRHWLASPDPAVDQQLFEIAVRGQEAVARRLTTSAQHRAMHAMAMSAGLQQGDASRLGARGLGALGSGSSHHGHGTSSCDDSDSMMHHQQPASGWNNSEPQAEPEPEAGAHPEPEPSDATQGHAGSSGDTEAMSRWSSRFESQIETVASVWGAMDSRRDGRNSSEIDSELEAGSRLIDGIRAIASASSVLIRLGHPVLLFQVEALVRTWVCVGRYLGPNLDADTA
jgi:hypothetical protein